MKDVMLAIIGARPGAYQEIVQIMGQRNAKFLAIDRTLKNAGIIALQGNSQVRRKIKEIGRVGCDRQMFENEGRQVSVYVSHWHQGQCCY